MLPKEFREQLLDLLLNFLWRQWSALGVLGTTGSEDEWILDPEALLLFSLELARYEPRLFDEILSWLWANGGELDLPRIKRMLLKRKSYDAAHLVAGTFNYMADFGETHKWNGIIKFASEKFMVHDEPKEVEPLFKLKSGEPHPLADANTVEHRFLKFGYNRPVIEKLRKGADVPVNARTNLRFLLRYFFGVGAKSEAALYLLTHESGAPAEMADVTGYMWLTVREALEDLVNSRQVLTRQKGKRIEYWLSQNKWWEFFSPGMREEERPKWLDWTAIFEALHQLWTTVDFISQESVSEYMGGSRLQDSLEALFVEFGKAGIAVPNPPSPGLPSEMRQTAALNYISAVLGS